MPQGYIQEATYQFSSLHPPGKWSNSWILQSVIQVSSSESKRTLEVPERSFGGFWHGGCPKDTPRKLHINFQICTCLGSAPSPICLQNVIMESKRTLEVPERSLGGLWDGGWLKDTSRKLHINFQVSTPMESCPMRRYELSVSEGGSEWVKFSFIELHTQLKRTEKKSSRFSPSKPFGTCWQYFGFIGTFFKHCYKQTDVTLR